MKCLTVKASETKVKQAPQKLNVLEVCVNPRAFPNCIKITSLAAVLHAL